MKNDKLEYDFLLELFKCCIEDKELLIVALLHMKSSYLPELFDDIWKEIVYQFTIKEKKPTIGNLKLKFRKKKSILSILQEIKDFDEYNKESIVSGFEEFVKSCKFIEVFNESSDLFNRGDVDKSYQAYLKGSEEIQNLNLTVDAIERVFGDFTKRQIKRQEGNYAGERVNFCIDELDKIAEMRTGQLVMYLAESKGGKSFVLSHHSVNCARMGFPTFHVQLEGTKEECFDRIDAGWSGSYYEDIRDGIFPDKKYKQYKRLVNKLGDNDIYVYAPEKFGAMTVVELRNKLIQLRKKIDIKCLVVDYAELLNPDNHNYKPNEERFRQQRVVQGLKDLAIELDILVITATQASNLPADLKNDVDFVLTREFLSEDKGKLKPVDCLITLNRTLDEQEAGICRLFVEASRHKKKTKRVVKIAQNLDRSRFYDKKKTIQLYLDEGEDMAV